jgi:hypothetical protein
MYVVLGKGEKRENKENRSSTSLFAFLLSLIPQIAARDNRVSKKHEDLMLNKF